MMLTILYSVALGIILAINPVRTEGDRTCQFCLNCDTISTLACMVGEGLRTVPDISDTNRVCTMNLSYNEIQCIKDNTFKRYSLLKCLYLIENQLTVIEDAAFCGTPLESLNLARNNLTAVPKLACLGSTLKNLNLRNNFIQTLNAMSVRGLNLAYLNLEYNCIHYIDPEAFVGLGHSIINLANNQLFCIKLVSSKT